MNDKLKALLLAVAEVTKIDAGLLRKKNSPNHRIAYAKHVFCYIGCNKLNFKQQEIGDFIGLSQGRVCQVTDRSNFVRINERGYKEIRKEIMEVELKYDEILANYKLGEVKY